MRLNDAEITKLKFGAVPSTVVSTLVGVEQSIFPNIYRPPIDTFGSATSNFM